MGDNEDRIKQAYELTKQVEALDNRIDELLMPVVRDIAADIERSADSMESEYERLHGLIRKIPGGFHRTELMTLLICYSNRSNPTP